MVCGLIAAASTFDPVLSAPGCNCEGEWYTPAVGAPVYLPAVAIALVAAVRFVFARTPPLCQLPVAVAGRAWRWAALYGLRMRCAASVPLRYALDGVNVLATIMVVLLLLFASSERSAAPMVVSHLGLLVMLLTARIFRD
jgi:hypothetical protein